MSFQSEPDQWRLLGLLLCSVTQTLLAVFIKAGSLVSPQSDSVLSAPLPRLGHRAHSQEGGGLASGRMADFAMGSEVSSWEDLATCRSGPAFPLTARVLSKQMLHSLPFRDTFFMPLMGLGPGFARSHLTLSTTRPDRQACCFMDEELKLREAEQVLQGHRAGRQPSTLSASGQPSHGSTP